MCDVCRQYPCNPRCPNADDPKVVTKCKNCGDKIYEGEEYHHIGDMDFCEECVREGRKVAEVD